MAELNNKMEVSAIFYDMMQNGSLTRANSGYSQLMEDPDQFDALKRMAASFECSIYHIGETMYLVPNPDNHFLGYSRAQLRKILLKGGETSSTYYLMMFILLVLLTEFYATDYGVGRRREYLLLGTLMNKVSDGLKNGAEAGNNDANIPFQAMLARWNALEAAETDSNKASTKKALFTRLFKFLEANDLIYYIEEQDQIRPRQKLDDLCDAVLRGDEGYMSVMRMVEEAVQDAEA